MKSRANPWQRLLEAARTAPEPAAGAAPYGFATRVVARAMEQKFSSGTVGLFARVSWPALGVAFLAATLALATNLKPLLNTFSEDVSALSDPVGEVGDSTA